MDRPTPTEDDLAFLSDIKNLHVRERVILERAVVRMAMTDLLAAGYALTVDYCDDEDDEPGPSTDMAFLMDRLMACDEEYLRAWKDRKAIGWLRLIYGNDGWDVIADYTTNLDEPLARTNNYSDQLAALLQSS